MKNPRFIITAIIILALAAFVIAERLSIQRLKAQVAQLQQARAAETASAQEELEKSRQKLADGKQVIAQLEARGKEVASHDASPKAPADAAAAEGGAEEGKGGEDFGKMVKKMFTDPKMKGVMRTTQMMGVKMMYSDLAKELGLRPDQADQVMELLGDRQMALATKSMKMMGGESGEAGDAASAEEPGTGTDDYDAQLENILGKDGMAKLKDFERTAGDRMQMQQYKQAFSAGGTPLDESQSQGLLSIMKEERMKLPPSPLDPGAKDVKAAMKVMQSDDSMNALMASQQSLNARVLSRSRNVLSPDQMARFEQIQKEQMDTQKAMMDMGRQFMKAK